MDLRKNVAVIGAIILFVIVLALQQSGGVILIDYLTEVTAGLTLLIFPILYWGFKPDIDNWIARTRETKVDFIFPSEVLSYKVLHGHVVRFLVISVITSRRELIEPIIGRIYLDWLFTEYRDIAWLPNDFEERYKTIYQNVPDAMDIDDLALRVGITCLRNIVVHNEKPERLIVAFTLDKEPNGYLPIGIVRKIKIPSEKIVRFAFRTRFGQVSELKSYKLILKTIEHLSLNK